MSIVTGPQVEAQEWRASENLPACVAIKEALKIPFDFSTFSIVADVGDVARFRIEGPLDQVMLRAIKDALAKPAAEHHFTSPKFNLP
jgi:hypothetical protein